MDSSLIKYGIGVTVNVIILLIFNKKMKDYDPLIFVLFSWLGLFLVSYIMFIKRIGCYEEFMGLPKKKPLKEIMVEIKDNPIEHITSRVPGFNDRKIIASLPIEKKPFSFSGNKGGMQIEKEKKQEKNDAVDFMNWTLTSECKYECVDQDEWNDPYYMENRQTYTTEEIYKIYREKNKKSV